MACRLSASHRGAFRTGQKKTRPRLSQYQTRLFSTGTWLAESRRRVFSNRARLFYGGAWLPRVPGPALFLRRLALRVPRPVLLGWRLAPGVPRMGLPRAALGSFSPVRQDPGPMSRTDSMCPRRMQDAPARVRGLEARHLECEEIVVEDRGQVHFLTAVSEHDPDSRCRLVDSDARA